MGSRLREKPDHLFEVFAEVARPGAPTDSAFVLQHYPEDLNDRKILEAEIPKFAFPCASDSSAVDHFSFVLTDEDGKFKFGFCRHAAGSQTCLCLVSFLPWFDVFYRLLNHVAEILNRTEDNSITPLLDALYKHPLPLADEKVELLPIDTSQAFSFTTPNTAELPCIPHNRNLTEYYNAVDVHNMMSLFASMIQERRIIVVSKKLSRLTACIHGSASLLYPLCWQHIYIPVIPAYLIDYCSAPMPYLIGIHSSLFQKLRPSEIGDAIILDADHNTIKSEFSDLEMLPPEVVSSLKKKLKNQSAEKIGTGALGDGVARAFLKTNVAIIGGYRQALRFPPGEQITFDEDAFIHSRPPSMQPFLQNILHTQMFEQFINDRLDKLIAGEGFSDIFDNEVNMEQDKWATQSRYKEWYGNMKKQGKKVRKEGKEKWVEFSSKANPAMKGAMKVVKDRSRKAVKDIRSKFDELRKEDSHKSSTSRNRPQTVQAGNSKPERPPRPPPPDHSSILGPISSPQESVLRSASYEKARQYKVISEDELDDSSPMPHTRPRSPMSPTSRLTSTVNHGHSLYRQSRHSRRMASEDTDILSDMTFQRVSLDLLGDFDIQTMLKKSYSLEDLAMHKEVDEEDVSSDDQSEGGEVISYEALAPDNEDSSVVENTLQEQLIEFDEEAHDVNDNKTVTSYLVNPASEAVSTGYLASKPEHANKTSDSLDTNISGSVKCVKHLNVQFAENKQSMGFDDNFVPNEQVAPPIPPKVPLNRGLSVDNSTNKDSQSSPALSSSLPVGSRPTPKPRNSINRQPAFYKQQRPPSFRKTGPQLATDALTIKDARVAFMNRESTKPMIHKRDDLDQFDPLVSGQLAVDTPQKDFKAHMDQEDNLLKEWNLDFETKLKVSTQARAVPGHVMNPYGSSPGGLNYMGGFHPGLIPGHPGSLPNKFRNGIPGVYYPHNKQHQTVQDLIQRFSPGGPSVQPTVPPRPMSVIMRDKEELVQLDNRPSSLYVEGPQDPFSELLNLPSSPRRIGIPDNKSSTLPNGSMGIPRPGASLVPGQVQGQAPLHNTLLPDSVVQRPNSPAIPLDPLVSAKRQSWETFE